MEQSNTSKGLRKQASHQRKPTTSSSSKGKITSLSSGSNSNARAPAPFPKLGSYASQPRPSTDEPMSYAGVLKNKAPSKKPPTSAPENQCPVNRPSPRARRPVRRPGRGADGSPRTREDDNVGKYQILETSAHELWCGKYSLQVSTREQLGQEMTLENFDRIRLSEASWALHKANGWTKYENNFLDEQLALVLYLFGLEHGKTLELGLIVEGGFAYTLALPKLVGATATKPSGAKPETVWIHNDNAREIRGGRGYNHYSGVKLIT